MGRLQFEMDTLAELAAVVKTLRTQSRARVIHLIGDLGAGKTTLVQEWLRQEGVREAVTSPTYALVNPYTLAASQALHADFYRLNDPEELLELDVREWPESAALIFIEWPEKGGALTPKADAICRLELLGTRRHLSWQEDAPC